MLRRLAGARSRQRGPCGSPAVPPAPTGPAVAVGSTSTGCTLRRRRGRPRARRCQRLGQLDLEPAVRDLDAAASGRRRGGRGSPAGQEVPAGELEPRGAGRHAHDPGCGDGAGASRQTGGAGVGAGAGKGTRGRRRPSGGPTQRGAQPVGGDGPSVSREIPSTPAPDTRRFCSSRPCVRRPARARRCSSGLTAASLSDGAAASRAKPCSPRPSGV